MTIATAFCFFMIAVNDEHVLCDRSGRMETSFKKKNVQFTDKQILIKRSSKKKVQTKKLESTN